MLSYLLCSNFLFITGNFSHCPIIIGIFSIGKTCLSHYAKCILTHITYIIVYYIIYLIK